jgi:hypothetical protein
MYLITHPKGLFYLYVQRNAINYSQGKTQPLNFRLTTSLLEFMYKVFTLPFQFTKYVFDEELMLFYIRTHYISFVKLYNVNYSEQRSPSALELGKQHLKCLFAIARQRTDDTRRKLYQFKILSFLL